MKKIILAAAAFVLILGFGCKKSAVTDTTGTTPTTPTTPTSSYNDLWIPPTVTGTTFNLTLAKSTKQFKTGAVTNTYGFNGSNFGDQH